MPHRNPRLPKQNQRIPKLLIIKLARVLAHPLPGNHHLSDPRLHNRPRAIHTRHDLHIQRAAFERSTTARRIANRIALGMLHPDETAVALVALPRDARPQAAASSPSYNVEMIVFAVSAGPAQREDWTAGGARLARGSDAGEAAAGGAQVGRFGGPLPAAQFQLNDVESKLAASGNWRPLAHVAWSQTASSWGSRAGFTLQQLGVRVPGLTGTVFLERGTYLHLGMSLKY